MFRDGIGVTLLMVGLAACSAEPSTIRVVPPEGTQYLDLMVLRGPCPSEEELRAGNTACVRQVLFRERVRSGAPLLMSPSVDGLHAIVAVAMNECAAIYACATMAEPGDVTLGASDFNGGSGGCGLARECTGGECVLACGAPLDASTDVADANVGDVGTFDAGAPVMGLGDPDGDGLVNCFECQESPVDCDATSTFTVEQCRSFDSDGDGTADYLDVDSDNDGYLDEWECPIRGMEPADLSLCMTGSGFDFRNPNPADDYDDDGIDNRTDCGGREHGPACVDDDRDGLQNYRDTNSDGDLGTDAQECPGGSAEGCPNTEGSDLPDFREPSPADCDCSAEAYGCTVNDAGICYQHSIVVGDDLRLQWLRPDGSNQGTPRIALNFFGRLGGAVAEVPAASWRCDGMEACEAMALGVITDVSGARLEPFLYVDVAEPERAPPITEPLPFIPREGRFLYGVTADGEFGIVSEIP